MQLFIIMYYNYVVESAHIVGILIKARFAKIPLIFYLVCVIII